jgi:hypothetical protein
MNTVREMSQKKTAAGRPDYPVGRAFKRFPMLTEMTFGLHGLMALYGGTGIGKSTLAAALAADAMDADFPCVYYDGENTFEVDGVEDSLTQARIAQNFEVTDARFSSFFITSKYQEAVDQIKTFPRGLLVVDTVQSSIAASAYEVDNGVRDALTARMAELAELSRRYAVLVVSQINNRNATAPQPLGAMKGASAIEQSLWAALALGVDKAGQRVLVLAKLRRPYAPAWPKGSRITIKSDGQDRLSEVATEPAKVTRPETVIERAQRITCERPDVSVRELGRLLGLGKTQAALVKRKVSGQVSGPDSNRTADRTAEMPGQGCS